MGDTLTCRFRIVSPDASVRSILEIETGKLVEAVTPCWSSDSLLNPSKPQPNFLWRIHPSHSPFWAKTLLNNHRNKKLLTTKLPYTGLISFAPLDVASLTVLRACRSPASEGARTGGHLQWRKEQSMPRSWVEELHKQIVKLFQKMSSGISHWVSQTCCGHWISRFLLENDYSSLDLVESSWLQTVLQDCKSTPRITAWTIWT